MKLKKILAAAARGAVLASAAFGGFVALLAAILFATGTVTWAGLRQGVSALRVPEPAPPAAPPSRVDEEWRDLEAAGRRQAETLAKMREELRRAEDLLALRVAELEKERREAEARRRQEEAGRAAAAAEAEVAANVPILSRMEPDALAGLMRDWDAARVVRYLRALRPSKAAEVLEALGPRAAALREEFLRTP